MRLAAAAALVLACAAGSASAAAASIRVLVGPAVSTEDQPVEIRVTGLRPSERAVVSVRSTDARNVLWRASAGFRADGRGTIDVARANALSGSYTGRWQMGLVASMRSSGASRDTAYNWTLGTPRLFRVDVDGKGARRASATFGRALAPGAVELRDTTLADEGFFKEPGLHLLYVNVHTAKNPNGEIRGQLAAG